jgi:putative cofactor-binding repeat protein
MTMDRRDMLLASFGFGLALAAGPRAWARESDAAGPFSTYGVVPAGGTIDQTATLQLAADQAAQSGTPFFLPPGIYATSRLKLKSGTHLRGVPGKSILRYRDGGALLSIGDAQDVRLDGLVLEGQAKPLGDGGALIVAVGAGRLDIADCRFTGSSEDGILLRRVSGRIADCDIGDIRKAGLFSEDVAGLEIARNLVHDCGDNGILVSRSAPGEDGTLITNNIVDKAATGIAVTNLNAGRLAVVQGNLVRNLFFRKGVDTRGNGIAVETDAAINGNVVENAPGFGIVLGRMRYVRNVSVASNLIRNAHIGIGVSADSQAGRALIADNTISGVKDGAIRALDGPRPIGQDLALASEKAFRNLSIYANVAR